ncbi:YjgN family protein [Achromobacter deleyi]|uniref:YjgN family protein n=1 Tax=Achromobacter deleyi TaxID=1353891 RepID=UPI0014662408|nr:YjgN family protein [Achromobacter deleyi]CAB3821904.1 hypothetical protein LMG3412_00301 [Achromobacter deleyi]
MSQQDTSTGAAASGFPSARSPQPIPDLQRLPVRFNGTARDYFGVWIVNLLLNIVTLGVWSAWAKVRTLRWFYGHTTLNGHGFDYHATGGQIFKGRLIAFLVIAAMMVSTSLWPRSTLIWYLFLLIVLPWAINAGLRFNAYMTSWSNVRFGFVASYGQALIAFLLLPIVSVFTLGLLAPLVTQYRAKYMARGYLYGKLPFSSTPRLGALYGALGRSISIFIGIGLLVTLIVYLKGEATGSHFSLTALLQVFGILHLPAGQAPDGDAVASLEMLNFIFLGFYVAIFLSGLYYHTCARKEILNQCVVKGGHRLQCHLSPLRYVWLVVSGLVVSLFTLTFAYPWAQVRQYRYLMQSITLLAAPGLDQVMTQQSSAPGTFGGEFSQLEGFASAGVV